MFKIEQIKVEDAERAARDLVRAQGPYRKIGSGAFGVVFGARGRDIVYKIGDANDNHGYLAYVQALSKSRKPNPWLPQIWGCRIYSDSKGHSWFVVAMERLEDGYKALKDYFYDAANELDEMFTYCDFTGAPRELIAAARLISAARKRSGTDWDLHSGNIMARGDQLVITDPLA